jgi:hypothetical protein
MLLGIDPKCGAEVHLGNRLKFRIPINLFASARVDALYKIRILILAFALAGLRSLHRARTRIT